VRNAVMCSLRRTQAVCDVAGLLELRADDRQGVDPLRPGGLSLLIAVAMRLWGGRGDRCDGHGFPLVADSALRPVVD
jgi:hypothetical protein